MTVKSVQLIDMDLDGFQMIIGKVVAKVLQENLNPILERLTQPSDEFLSRKEAAEFLKISETTLWSLDKTQVLPAKRLQGKVLYLKSDLLNFHKHSA
ncbi:helix-turn-helix domain-containing protein [Tenacibaculum aquimarinum]|uniref:helix-turn-helix domain-containing protein n=1 Tax=Tenacibaculum aquimarinum TaxID=2910675 RepID=UPI001F0A492F|nr:helix-turn-helix domain-containing protein [Tenacibaculum aquimarinum]MCH3884404.1 helix-turn-helix domain-containing protein [Tenacibaculum aquimarinum]